MDPHFLLAFSINACCWSAADVFMLPKVNENTWKSSTRCWYYGGLIWRFYYYLFTYFRSWWVRMEILWQAGWTRPPFACLTNLPANFPSPSVVLFNLKWCFVLYSGNMDVSGFAKTLSKKALTLVGCENRYLMISFSFQKSPLGEELFQQVTKDLSIEEKEYFSLCFYDIEHTRVSDHFDYRISACGAVGGLSIPTVVSSGQLASFGGSQLPKWEREK